MKKLQAGINSSWICGLREFFKIGAKMRFCLKLALTMDRPVVERGLASFVALPKNRTHCCSSSSSPRYTWKDRPSFCIAIREGVNGKKNVFFRALPKLPFSSPPANSVKLCSVFGRHV